MPRTTPHCPPVTGAPGLRVDVPPLVAGIVRLAEPNYKGLPPGFVAAYKAAPDLAQDFIETTCDEPRFRLVDQLSGVDYAEKHPDTPPAQDHGLAAAVAAVRNLRGDHYTNLMCPIADAAFYLGIAYACHMLTNGGTR